MLLLNKQAASITSCKFFITDRVLHAPGRASLSNYRRLNAELKPRLNFPCLFLVAILKEDTGKTSISLISRYLRTSRYRPLLTVFRFLSYLNLSATEEKKPSSGWTLMTIDEVTTQARLDVEYEWVFQCESECWGQSLKEILIIRMIWNKLYNRG